MGIQKVVLNYRLYREFKHHILYPTSSTSKYSPHINSASRFGNIPCRITVVATLTPQVFRRRGISLRHGTMTLFGDHYHVGHQDTVCEIDE